MRFPALLVAWATAFGPASFSQNQPAPPESTAGENVIHVNVNLVQMDAVVADSKGNPVENLKAGDFEILQDGKSQKITNFSFISTRPAAAPANQSRTAAQSKIKPVPPPPFMPKPSDIHRTIALVVDDLGLSFESIARVRSSLKKFVDTQVQPGDLVAVVRTGAGMGSLQQFSTDKRLLNAAIDRIKYNPLMSRVGVSSFEPLGSGGDGRAIAELRSSVFSVGTLGAIRYVVDGLRELPGRKTVVLFSENLQLFHRNDPDPRVMDGVRNLIDAANRASVVIDSIDTRGLEYYGLTAADNTAGMTARQISRVPMQRSAQVFRSQDGLVMLAHDTGGLFYQNSNDILGEVQKAVRDSDGYYLIAYHPPADTFDAQTGRPKFHSVKVRVKVAGLTVRSRTGFLNHSDALEQPAPRTSGEQIRRALYSPFNSGKVHLRLTALFTNSATQGSFITGLLHIAAKDLSFTDQPDGWHKGVIDVVAITFGDQGQTVDSTSRTFTVTLKGETYQHAVDDGLFFQFRHPVKPGYYQLRVALRDEESQQVGSANQFIEVPDVSKGLTLSSLMVAKEPPAAKPAGDSGEGQVAQQDPKGNPALRIFKPGDSLAYVYQVLNAGTDSARHSDLEGQTRLFRDGQQVYEGKPMPLETIGQQDPKHLVGGGAMRLGAKLQPGDYVLQVIVTDKSGGEKHHTATQSTDFEVAQ
ncbi:MAG TPA: VWA domain-containing protein [Bryobacteraceae bacterium]|jgi:VWFA-related protein|nr:VWA domain-containing protein [Bryobacteraceae bacterium]